MVTNFIVEDTGSVSGSGAVSSSASKTLQTLVSREFFLRDTVPPVYFDYSAANLLQGSLPGSPPSHAIRPGGTAAVQDDQAQGALLVRHVLTFGQPTDEQLEVLFADPAAFSGATTGLGAFGSHLVPASQFVPNAPLLLSRFPSLATSKVVRFSGPDAWTVESVADNERKTVVSTLAAQDASGNKSSAETSYVVLDTTAPAVGPVAVTEVTDVSARVSAQATDSGDANAGVARTATYAGLFETASLPTNAFGIVAPSFDPATGLFAGAIESKTVGESGSVVFGASGGQPLDDFTEYTVFVCAVDSCPAKNASAFRTATFKTLDGTPPVGLDLVSLTTASVTATSVAVEGLDLVTDAGDGVQSLSLFYGLSPDFASAVQAAGSPFSPGSTSAPTSAFVVGGLDDATLYHIWVSATDGRNPAGPVPVGSARTLDATDPVISAFDATQTAGGYSFSASSGTLLDNADGPMKAYLVMCAASQTTEQLEAIMVTGGAAMQASAKNEAFAYSVASGAVQLSTANLTASEYWTGTAWASISETVPSAPHQLWAHLLVVDAAGNAGSAQNLGAIKTVADRNAPTVSTFGATQSPTGYSFSLDASTRVADTRAGPLKTYFFLATAAIGDAKAFVATHAANAAVAKNEAVAYSSSSGAVAPPALTASKFWNGSAWTDVVEATTTVNAHFVVLDAAGNAASATVAKTVTDVTAPAFSGTVALTAENSTSVKAAWSAGISDGRGVTEGRVYYSATAPAATTAAGIAAWKAAATTSFAAVSPLSLLAAAGSATVTGLTAGTTYHVYLCAKDGAGNELNVATAPSNVTTTIPVISSSISATSTPDPGVTTMTIADWIAAYMQPPAAGAATTALVKASSGELQITGANWYHIYKGRPVDVLVSGEDVTLAIDYRISATNSTGNKRDFIGIGFDNNLYISVYLGYEHPGTSIVASGVGAQVSQTITNYAASMSTEHRFVFRMTGTHACYEIRQKSGAVLFSGALALQADQLTGITKCWWEARVQENAGSPGANRFLSNFGMSKRKTNTASAPSATDDAFWRGL